MREAVVLSDVKKHPVCWGCFGFEIVCMRLVCVGVLWGDEICDDLSRLKTEEFYLEPMLKLRWWQFWEDRRIHAHLIILLVLYNLEELIFLPFVQVSFAPLLLLSYFCLQKQRWVLFWERYIEWYIYNFIRMFDVGCERWLVCKRWNHVRR